MSANCAKAFVAMLAVVLTASVASAADRSRGIGVERQTGDDLSLWMMVREGSGPWRRAEGLRPAVPIGAAVAVCARSNKKGVVSLWSRTSDGEAPVRVLPNDFTPEERRVKGAAMDPGVDYCFGDGDDGYRFVVSPPTGDAEVYLHWTPSLSLQFGPEDIPVIPELGDTRSGAGASRSGYQSTTFRYSVVNR